MTRTNGQSYSTNTNDANYNKSPEFYEINSKLENYSQNVTRKLDALAEEISTIKENKENAAYGILILEETVNDLKKEKYELNRENEDLKEKNKNLFQSLSEVRAKVIELQDEKSSLITALKLIQRESVSLAEKKKIEDLESENKNLRAAARTLQEDLDKSNREKREFAKVKKRSENVSITPNTTISYESKNQFEVLSVSDHEEEVNKSASDLDRSEARHHNTDISAKHGDKPRQSGDKPNQRRSGQNSRKIKRRQQSKGNIQDRQSYLDERKDKSEPKATKQRQPNIVILVDSMLKHLNPRRIQQGIDQKISIKTFPGAGVDEMTHYVKPTLQEKPKHIILHIGTNDLQTKSPDGVN
ncbi:Hypothetical predicted protein [Paramuricea clavata]|uniref:Uncharacterized protein n=1 Tax=Paramuricea clavata TaxID=317549 RepID=A0A7D9IWT1_PARCT|nr:Hypothetical predicted protein [Paramuricea clavata]